MKRSIIFWFCLITAIGLFVGGFFVPPMAVIDGSLLTAGGILFGFATVDMIPQIVKEAKVAKITTGNTSIEVHGKEKDDKNLNNGKDNG